MSDKWKQINADEEHEEYFYVDHPCMYGVIRIRPITIYGSQGLMCDLITWTIMIETMHDAAKITIDQVMHLGSSYGLKNLSVMEDSDTKTIVSINRTFACGPQYIEDAPKQRRELDTHPSKNTINAAIAEVLFVAEKLSEPTT